MFPIPYYIGISSNVHFYILAELNQNILKHS